MRVDGRKIDELRPVRIVPNYQKHPSGSCLIEMGNTRVICSVMVEESIPHWLKGSGRGWLTAEYSMLPGASGSRIARERFKLGGRTQEIQRLIGRALRTSLDLSELGERSVLVDCDVLDADGGTRTASITGAWVALHLAAKNLRASVPQLSQALAKDPGVAAISVGQVGDNACLDLCYEEDRDAAVDMNVVMNRKFEFIELQGTAESTPFDHNRLNEFVKLAHKGIRDLFELQSSAVNA
ncbi:MAG: ribonuclease PH [Bdellovibrionales bacterium]|nr:ribonuclease PH [Bdellovibrionales bacterium]